MNPDCARSLDLLLRSLDEPLAAEEARTLGAHVAACPDCAVALREHVVLRTTLAGLDEAPAPAAPPLPADLVRRCVAAMRAARGGATESGAAGGVRTA